MKKMPANNEYTVLAENNAGLFRRLYIYQKERFPLIGHGLLILAFSFSAIAYSRTCRGIENFISLPVFAGAFFISFTLFALLRLSDEQKDKEDDAQFRPQLPVPRGLVTLAELSRITWIIIAAQVAAILLLFPKMLVFYAVILLYLYLMRHEFFIAAWLKKHQFWYVISHMFIIPFVDIFVSGTDWYLAGVTPPAGLLFFFAVSYMNGIVLEVGRKMKAVADEKEGVLTYTTMLGKKATWLWISVLLLTYLLSMGAGYYTSHGNIIFIVLTVILIICSFPAIMFYREGAAKWAKLVEHSSAVWTLSMYLVLGAAPMISQFFGK